MPQQPRKDTTEDPRDVTEGLPFHVILHDAADALAGVAGREGLAHRLRAAGRNARRIWNETAPEGPAGDLVAHALLRDIIQLLREEMAPARSKSVEYAPGAKPPGIRVGQAAFEVLSLRDFAKAEEIRGTDADPFYDDRKLPAFWRALGCGRLDDSADPESPAGSSED